MKHSLSSQIQAIQVVRKLIASIADKVQMENKDLDERLNDAGSTIAALNMTKSASIKPYTPGPWVNSLTGIKSIKGLLIAQCWTGENNDSFGHHPAVPYQEFLANEVLISKTPDMYEALKAADVAFEMIRIHGYDEKLSPQAISALNEAMPLVSEILFPDAIIERAPAEKIYTASISHKHGTNLFHAKSQASLNAQIFTFVKTYWEEEFKEGTPIPDDTLEAIETYFESAGNRGEYLEEFEPVNITEIQ